MLNTSAATEARHSRSGKDAMLYNADGVPFAQVSSFQSKTSFNNTKYQPLGQNRELETNNTIGVTITISEIVVLDGELFNNVVSAVNKGESPVMTLDGVIEGRNGSQERITYRECIFSGDQDLQNVSTGDTLSRSYNLHCNGEVEPRSSLTICIWSTQVAKTGHPYFYNREENNTWQELQISKMKNQEQLKLI